MDPLESIKVTFLQESEELLADLEAGLLALEAGEGDGETINAVFRAVHSIKGGAGAFGFEALVAFAHVFETALDAMRSGALEVEAETVRLMLRAADVLADHVQAARTGAVIEEARSSQIVRELGRLGGEPEEAAAGDAVEEDWFTPVAVSPVVDRPPWRIELAPRTAMFANGHEVLLLLRELERLGPVSVELDVSALPEFETLDPESSCLSWQVSLAGDADEAAIREVFDFVGDDCALELARGGAELEAPPPVDIDALLRESRSGAVSAPGASAEEAAPQSAPRAAATPTIRVDLERVDRLINLVGELVINQAMLAQRVGESELNRSSTVAIGLDELEQLTREIQDSVMAIRAQPVKSVFQRMPRLVREIADSTGKRVRLMMEGEGTEVDKTVIERLADPITHMLRNAIDHGLETPDVRLAGGKSAEGTVRLAALHRSGRVVIEVSDDGKGINRQRVRETAIAKGLIAEDAILTDDEIDNLIFLPGFSTASSVSNISGRGVGMDVVKRSIQSLGGRITISSEPGKGSTFTLSLPLTLAVLDGMVVTVGGQTLVAPLNNIVETLRPRAADVRAIGPKGAVLSVRGAHVPLVDIGVALGWRTAPIEPTAGVTLLVETEVGGRAALVVDAIQGQRQVVIKSLEANYQRVEAIAAATILGDGRVALILDVDNVVATRAAERGDLQALAKAS